MRLSKSTTERLAAVSAASIARPSIALRKEFLERLEQSPIAIEDRKIIDLSDEIDIVDGELVRKIT